jgi:hypothetical protein
MRLETVCLCITSKGRWSHGLHIISYSTPCQVGNDIAQYLTKVQSIRYRVKARIQDQQYSNSLRLILALPLSVLLRLFQLLIPQVVRQHIVAPSASAESLPDVCSEQYADAQPFWHKMEHVEYGARRGRDGVEDIRGAIVEYTETVDRDR